MIFLVSNLLNYKKENGMRIPQEINNDNNIVDELRENLISKNSMLYIASDPNDYKKIEDYSSLTFESFKKSGIEFNNYNILDNRNKDDAKELIKNSDFIYLSGGDTYIQNKFFESINLKEFLKEYNGIILGISAGAINLAKTAYDSPERLEDIKKPHVFDGLDKTTINVEPHFILDTKNFNEDELMQRNEVLKESYNRDIYALTDGSHILIKNDEIVIHGEVYIISSGKISKITNNKEHIIINKNKKRNDIWKLKKEINMG